MSFRARVELDGQHRQVRTQRTAVTKLLALVRAPGLYSDQWLIPLRLGPVPGAMNSVVFSVGDATPS